jgi:DNA repair protein RadC
MSRLIMKELAIDDRPYEKLEAYGSQALSDSELVAILLRTGRKGKTSLELARDLLAGQGAARIGRQSLEEIQSVAGIGRVKAITLKAAIEFGRRVLQEKRLRRGDEIRCPSDAIALFEPLLAPLDREEFHVLLLDTRHRVIRSERVSSGGLASAVIAPRDVFRLALRANAAALMLAHNHPSGDPTPSRQDIEATRVFSELGSLMGIPVLDHLILGSESSCSLKQLGYL